MSRVDPYYAVIFTSIQNEDSKGYKEMSIRMDALAKLQEGFLGMATAKNEIGITVSYWQTLEAIKKWKQHSAHLLAQQKGKSEWYSWYNVKICKIEHEYEFPV